MYIRTHYLYFNDRYLEKCFRLPKPGWYVVLLRSLQISVSSDNIGTSIANSTFSETFSRNPVLFANLFTHTKHTRTTTTCHEYVRVRTARISEYGFTTASSWPPLINLRFPPFQSKTHKRILWKYFRENNRLRRPERFPHPETDKTRYPPYISRTTYNIHSHTYIYLSVCMCVFVVLIDTQEKNGWETCFTDWLDQCFRTLFILWPLQLIFGNFAPPHKH